MIDPNVLEGIDIGRVQSPSRLRRSVTNEEIAHIREDVRREREEEGRDDAYFYIKAQAYQVEAIKIEKSC